MQPTSTLQTYVSGIVAPYLAIIGQALRAMRDEVNTGLALINERMSMTSTAGNTVVPHNATEWVPDFPASRALEATIDSPTLLLRRPVVNGGTVAAGVFTISLTVAQDCALTFDTGLIQVITGQPSALLAGQYLVSLDVFATTTYVRIFQLLE